MKDFSKMYFENMALQQRCNDLESQIKHSRRCNRAMLIVLMAVVLMLLLSQHQM